MSAHLIRRMLLVQTRSPGCMELQKTDEVFTPHPGLHPGPHLLQPSPQVSQSPLTACVLSASARLTLSEVRQGC